MMYCIVLNASMSMKTGTPAGIREMTKVPSSICRSISMALFLNPEHWMEISNGAKFCSGSADGSLC